jgi:hypothetical protein
MNVILGEAMTGIGQNDQQDIPVNILSQIQNDQICGELFDETLERSVVRIFGDGFFHCIDVGRGSSADVAVLD